RERSTRSLRGRPSVYRSGSRRRTCRRCGGAARFPRAAGVVLVRETVHGALGLAGTRLDPVAVLALGPLVDGLRGLVQTVLDPVLVLLREAGDLVLGRAEFGLQIVQQTHDVPSLAFPRGNYVRAPSPVSLSAASEDCCFGMSTVSVPRPASFTAGSAVSGAPVVPVGSAVPAASCGPVPSSVP